MPGIRHFVSKILVWLAVVLLPLQPLLAASCGCATPREAEHDAQQQTACGGNACCCEETPAVPANLGGGPEAACGCSADNTSLPAPQALAPAERQGQTLTDLAQPLAAVSLTHGEPQGCPSLFPADCPMGAWGFERCIALCRFIL